jgi:Holliday junction resolvase
MAYRNQFDRNGKNSLHGNSAEKLFEQILIKKGYVVRAATFAEQVNKHVDFFAEKDGKITAFEIKARKKTNRVDKEYDDLLLWIEFRSVAGRAGWIYGASDKLIFERLNDFVSIDRLKLVEICESKCDLTSLVTSAKDALYRGYQRSGRRDIISMIKMTDILQFSEIISK